MRMSRRYVGKDFNERVDVHGGGSVHYPSPLPCMFCRAPRTVSSSCMTGSG